MFDNMNILDYINYLVEECGYREEDAERCAMSCLMMIGTWTTKNA